MTDIEKIILSELREIKRDIKELQAFKWRVAGGAAALSVFLTGLAEFLHLCVGK